MIAALMLSRVELDCTLNASVEMYVAAVLAWPAKASAVWYVTTLEA